MEIFTCFTSPTDNEGLMKVLKQEESHLHFCKIKIKHKQNPTDACSVETVLEGEQTGSRETNSETTTVTQARKAVEVERISH